MAKCINITPTRKKICIGGLRYRINIYDRDIVGVATEGSAVHSETYTLFKTVFAGIETKKGGVIQTMNDVVIDPDLIVTHIFITRFLSIIKADQFIEFNNLNYKILKAENLDEADLWLRLSANFRGAFNKPGAQ